MKCHRYLLAVPAAAIVVGAAAACGSSGDNARPAGATASPLPPETSPSAGSPSAGSPSAVSPSVSASPQGQVSAQDRQWLAEIHQVNLAEMQVGDLAAKKGATAAVRSAGETLSTEHTALDRKVKRVAERLGVSLPTSPPAEDAQTMTRLADESGSQFDQDFLAAMITGHEKMINDTQTEIAQGSSPQVVGLAKRTLTHLHKHLAILKKAQTTG